MEIKAYRRNFYDEVVLIDENRRIENPQVGYVVSAAYPAVGVSVAGETREFILPSDDEFWSAAEEIRNQAVISTAIANCGGKENLKRIFSRLSRLVKESR